MQQVNKTAQLFQIVISKLKKLVYVFFFNTTIEKKIICTQKIKTACRYSRQTRWQQSQPVTSKYFSMLKIAVRFFKHAVALSFHLDG